MALNFTYFLFGPVPVLTRKGIYRIFLNSKLNAPLDGFPEDFRSFSMSFYGFELLLLRPSTVSIHNNSYVFLLNNPFSAIYAYKRIHRLLHNLHSFPNCSCTITCYSRGNRHPIPVNTAIILRLGYFSKQRNNSQ